MSRFILKTIICTAFFLSVGLIYGSKTVSAAYLYFNPQSITVKQGDVFSVDVWVDTVGQQVLSTNVYMPYDKNLFSIQSITPGQFFPYQVSNSTDTLISIRLIVTDANQSVIGVGKLATITLLAKSPGNSIFSFFCELGASTTSSIIKNDLTATNIINCSENRPLALTIEPAIPTSVPCSIKNQGDADCNSIIDLVDFEIWRKEFTQVNNTKNGDFNGDGTSNIIDFEIWRKNIFK